MMFHVTSSAAVARCAGIRLGRITEVPDNDPVFGKDAETIVREWCGRSGITYLGSADIGHDAANKVVPFRSALD
jgi:muramoyltetrapeptide carboxypeptidase